ncbi:MAG: PAS domain-containing sensor histidine kinase [Lysobacter sp.]
MTAPDGFPSDIGLLYEHAPCGLLLTDDDGTIRHANATFCRWVGIERGQLLGKRRFQDLLTMGGRIFHQTQWAPLLQMQGSIAEVKLDLVRQGAAPLPMVMNAIRREREGVVMHEMALFVAEDRHSYERELLAARKRAEELLVEQKQAREALAVAETRLRMALEAGALHVWEMDPATGERHFDPGVALLLGRDQPGPVSFADYGAAVHAEDREQALKAFARMLEVPDSIYRHSYRIDGDDGVQRTVLATARAVLDATGAPGRVFGLLQDITQLSAQRAAAEDRALFAEQMVGIVSHDLRNPLSTIRLGGQVLEMAGLAGNQQRVLGNITRATTRALRLINDLLDFTRARLGQGLAVNVVSFDLHAAVATQVEELALAYPRATLLHRPSGDHACVADPDRLAQLVGNLVSNAAAYGAPDEPIVVASMTHGDGFTVSVHNAGEAITEPLLAGLFQPMVRGTEADIGSRSVGLGLYIVAEIMRAHGGTVTVISTVGHGTEFQAEFPQRGH